MLKLNDQELSYLLYLAEGNNESQSLRMSGLTVYEVAHLVTKVTDEVQSRKKQREKIRKYEEELETAKKNSRRR